MESATINVYPYASTPQGFVVKTVGRVVVIDGQHGEYYPDEPANVVEYYLDGPGLVGDGIQEVEEEEEEEEQEDEQEEEEYEPIEGNTEFDVGWMYVNIDNIKDLYARMCEDPDSWIKPYFYKRPPAVWAGDLG